MKITILGAAGAVGAPTAFYLAAHQLADEIVLIGGTRQNVLQQHVMDMRTAISAYEVTLYAGTYEDMAGSHIVINAAGHHQDGPEGRGVMLQANVPLMCEIADSIKRLCSDAVIITATNPVGPLNYAIYLAGGFDRRRVIGYSLNDTLRLRELAAAAFDVAADRLSGVVIGEHGPTQVPVFSSVQIDGRPVMVTPEIQQRIRDRASVIIQQFQSLKAGRTAGWTCAVGLAAFVRAIVHDSGALLPCSLVLDGEYGQHGLSMSVPATIGRQGVCDIQELSLTSDEAAALAISTKKLKGEMQAVEQMMGLSA